jgi:hypothetical protein
MYDKIKKLNRSIRQLIAIIGLGVVIFHILDKRTSQDEPNKDGFQTKEFDDIW